MASKHKHIEIDDLLDKYKHNLTSNLLDKECTADHIRKIALFLDSVWELLAPRLGLTKQQVEAIKVNNATEEVRREAVLVKWRETYAFKATYRVLLDALLTIKRADLACDVCELLASSDDPKITISEAICQIIDTQDTYSADKQTKMKKWVEEKKDLRIIVTGKTGAGKSSLLNSFVGATIFEEGDDHDPCTKVVSQKEFAKDGIRVIVWDCPGLQDGTENKEAYLKDLAKKTERNVDLMLYCVNMSENRATDLKVHGSAIRKLTKIVGQGVWSNTVIALTFANIYQAQIQTKNPQIRSKDMECEFQKRIDLWKTKIDEALQDIGVEDEVVSALSVFPAGYHTVPHLPGYPLWASRMWETMVLAVKQNAQPLPIMLNVRRLRNDRSKIKEKDFLLPLEEQPIYLSEDLLYESASKHAVVGAILGSIPGGAVGTGTRVAAGVAAGNVAEDVDGGIAGGVAGRLAVGTTVGMVVGAGIGLATGLLSYLFGKRKL